MSKISKLYFCALNVSGDNYFQWALDTKIMLGSKGLSDTITEDNNSSDKDRYKAIYMIRHHMVESLKGQYLTIKNPLDLWNELKQRYDHRKTVLLLKARYEWMNLRIQDFKSVDEYNSAMLKIVSTMKLCGENISDSEMLEKTYSTFHTSNMLLQKKCREKGFKTFSSLITCLLLAEQNNELLMRNIELRPPGSASVPNNQSGNGRGKSYGRGRGNFRTQGGGRGRGRGNPPGFSRGTGHGRSVSFKPQYKSNVCHRCGMDNHWAKNCRTAEHLVNLYKESQKNKNPEANMVYQDGEDDMDHDQGDPME